MRQLRMWIVDSMMCERERIEDIVWLCYDIELNANSLFIYIKIKSYWCKKRASWELLEIKKASIKYTFLTLYFVNSNST